MLCFLSAQKHVFQRLTSYLRTRFLQILAHLHKETNACLLRDFTRVFEISVVKASD